MVDLRSRGLGCSRTEGQDTKTAQIIRPEPDGSWICEKGNVFFLSWDRTQNATRGSSFLLPLLDYLDVLDESVFTLAERQSFLNAFVWDVELEGASESDCMSRAAEMTAPAPGSVRFHNEKEKWKTAQPNLEAHEQQATAELVMRFVLAGAGVPEHWMGRAEDINRATAESMAYPVRRRIEFSQEDVQTHIETMIEAQIAVAKREGKLAKGANTEFHAIPPEMPIENLSSVAMTIQQATAGLALAVEEGFIDRPKAKNLFGRLMQMSGIRSTEENEEDVEEEGVSYGESIFFRESLSKRSDGTPAGGWGRSASLSSKADQGG